MQYDKLRQRGTRADDYLCRLCKASQASAWDHRHDHGHVRGPLCGSCNTREGKATPYYFLQLEGTAMHLLECRGCLEQRTLPRRFHLDVVRTPGTDRAARTLRQAAVRPRGGAHRRCPPVPSAVQRLAYHRQLDEGCHRVRSGPARTGLRRRGPRHAGTHAALRRRDRGGVANRPWRRCSPWTRCLLPPTPGLSGSARCAAQRLNERAGARGMKPDTTTSRAGLPVAWCRPSWSGLRETGCASLPAARTLAVPQA
ncbi:endonuclease VII domain-containing protein (plasmid) [Streptomyces sp. AD2-2]|nr:endonuclease VII domain-containing protein [Streptomyces sp. AD2-2]